MGGWVFAMSGGLALAGLLDGLRLQWTVTFTYNRDGLGCWFCRDGGVGWLGSSWDSVDWAGLVCCASGLLGWSGLSEVCE